MKCFCILVISVLCHKCRKPDTLFDPLNGVTATDGNGNDITSKIKILKNNVDTKEEGEYEVIYSVTNDKGNTLQRTRKVTVLKSKKSGD